MPAAEALFWACLALALYPYVVYPAVLWVLARWLGRPVRRVPHVRPVSFVVCANNEEGRITGRLIELLTILEETGIPGEVILVSDGSTDRTCEMARAFSRVKVVELAERVGKAAALTRGASEATGEVLVFADVRQTWAPEALELLLENFADPEVGAASGDLCITSGPGAMEGVGLYWRFEKWLRAQESLLFAQVGVTGAICAVRRELFRPIPAGTILDDVHWPLEVALQGKRVVHDERARAFDRFPEKASDEMRRKVRTLAGNFQLATLLPAALLPWRSRVWLKFLSHKLARLLSPWALLGALTANVLLVGQPLYLGALIAQVSGYSLGLFALATGRGGKLGAAAASVLVMNAAAWVAFWVWVTGRASRSWHRVSYVPQPARETEAPAAS
jgi:cellulose synthase/poly-beta-1,6-N-acetylglucosamine synthase-like glycosyltransferase